MSGIMKGIKRIISSIEDSKAPFIYFILTFLFATTLRNFIEIFSSEKTILIDYISHYYLFYITFALVLILLFHIVTREKIVKVSRIILTGYIVVILTPIIDLILTKGKGYVISYIMPGYHDNLLLRFFTFFGQFSSGGVSIGQKIEIALILVGCFIYFRIKKQSIIKSLFSTFIAYALLFFYGILPFILTGILALFNLTYEASNILYINFYLANILIVGITLLYLIDKKIFKLIIKDIRPFRSIYYELMFIFGLILGFNSFTLTYINIFYFLFIPISILFAILFSIITNNIADYEIDTVSNKSRPLINSKINPKTYTHLSWLFLFIALIYAAIASFETFFIILLFIGNYFLYSMPPLRLKRIPFFSKLFISSNSLILIMLGFIIMGNPITNFPRPIILLFLIGFTAVINFIDIKDYEGDKKEGIKTLPVLFGLKKAKILIGVFFVLISIWISLIANRQYSIIPFSIMGIILFYTVNKSNYNEKHVFYAILFTFLIFFSYLLNLI